MKKEFDISNNFYVVQGWMIQKLGLKGGELTIYAIIHGYSQNYEGEFYGSCELLSKWSGLKRPTIVEILKKLTEKGLLKKISSTNTSKPHKYKALIPLSENRTDPVRKPDIGMSENLTRYIIII